MELKFAISNSQSIIVSSDEEFTQFAKITVSMVDNLQKYVLFDDFLSEGVGKLKSLCQKALMGELQIPQEYWENGLGYWWNKYANSLPEDGVCEYDEFSKYWLWSTPSAIGIETWMYNRGNETIVEISTTYPWHFEDPEDIAQYRSFEDFMKSYEPIRTIKLKEEIVRQWYSQCQDILSTL